MKLWIEGTRLPAALAGAGLCLTLALGASPAALADETSDATANEMADFADAAATAKASTQPTAAEAAKFIDEAEKRLKELNIEAGRAAWVQANFITYDTQVLSAAR